jgi:hypothetical protein
MSEMNAHVVGVTSEWFLYARCSAVFGSLDAKSKKKECLRYA